MTIPQRDNALVALDHLRSFTFEPTRGTWDETPRTPATDMRGSTAVCDVNEIHLLSGSGFFGPGFQHLIYSIPARTWRTSGLRNLPNAVDFPAAGIWDGKIFVAGGFGNSGITGLVQVFDKITNEWLPGPFEAMPVPVAGAGYAQQGHYLYVVGGRDRGDVVAVTQRLDLTTGRWERGPDLGLARYRPGMVATDKALYALGGTPPVPSGGAFVTDRVDRLDLANWTAGWQQQAPLPTPTAELGAGCTQPLTGGEIWAVGGKVGANGAGPAGPTSAAYFRPVAGERCDTVVRDVPWLSSSAATATVTPDASITTQLTVDARFLRVGTHRATVLVRTNDPGAAEIRVPLTVTVTGR